MINTTMGELVFLKSGAELHASIEAAINDASKWILQAYKLENLDLSLTSTFSFVSAAYPYHVKHFILQETTTPFDEQYVTDVFTFINTDTRFCSPQLYSDVTRCPQKTKNGKVTFRKTYIPYLRRGFSTFLVALHIRRAIVLPFSFKWPTGIEYGNRGQMLHKRELCPLEYLPELLRFIRSLDISKGSQQSDPLFNSYTPKQRERLACMSQRLIIAGGWLEPSDVNYEDLLSLKSANDKTRFSGNNHLSILMFTELLDKKYKTSSPVNAAGWQKLLFNTKPARFLDRFGLSVGKGNAHLVQQAAEQPVALVAPDALTLLDNLPGLDFPLRLNAEIWISIERTYLRISRLENDKFRIHSIAHLNLYLFAYLPYWYAENPDFEYKFPSEPSKLISAVFVSDLGLIGNMKRPMTFIEFFNAETDIRGWADTSKYSSLKQVQLFFEFIEKHNESLPGAKGFRQPINRHDYPLTKRATGTNKRPIPRRIFKLFLTYTEAIATLSSVILEKALRGELSEDELTNLHSRRSTINCIKDQNSLGFIPVVFHKGKAHPLAIIPNVLNMELRNLTTGNAANIPHPHGLHQILVSLYSGLRHNHIQWLDCSIFDQFVGNDNKKRDFAELCVNSDKAKNTFWKSFVNYKVIEILREQRAWRELIGEPNFKQKVYYNNNPVSKWGSFYALFAYLPDGRPHGDNFYSSCWRKLIGGLQSLLCDVGENSIQLFRYLPPGFEIDDPNLNEKLLEYGSKQNSFCEIRINSYLKPHSARVSLVSHAITFLPADLIGRHWTGQTEATVYHYVVPDEDETYTEQQRQNLSLRNSSYELGYEASLRKTPVLNSPYIKANEVNSNLTKCLKDNFEETITNFGCISLSYQEEAKTGIDVLRNTRGMGAAENLTEICPYGNLCPPEIVVQLKDWRRCGPCQFAIRSVDHLPAISAKIRQVLEGLLEIESRIAEAEINNNYTASELDSLEYHRNQLAEDLAAWQMSAEVLEVMRQRIASGQSTKAWHVQKPEIIEKNLRLAVFPSLGTEYVLARLHECEEFPTLESPQIRARFDLLRRKLLANTGNIREALKLEPSAKPGAECLGLLRSIIAAHKLTPNDIKRMLESDAYLDSLPSTPLKLLPPDFAS